MLDIIGPLIKPLLLCTWMLFLAVCWGRLIQFWFDLQLKGGRGTNLAVNLMLGLMLFSGIAFLWGMIGGLNIYAAYILLIVLSLSLIPLRGYLETAGLVIRDIEKNEQENILSPTFNLLITIMLFLNLYGALEPVQSSEALSFSLALPQYYVNSGRIVELTNNLRSYLGHNWEMLYLWGLLLESALLCRLLDIALFFMSGILLYRWCTRKFGTETGVIAGVLWFCSSILHQIPGTLTHFNALASFSLLAFLFWDRWHFGKGRHFLAASGILAGFAIGIDHYALYFPLIPLIIITLSSRTTSSSSFIHRLGAALIFSVTAFLVYTPWLLKNLILYIYRSGDFSVNGFFPVKPIINPFIPANVLSLGAFAGDTLDKMSDINVLVIPLLSFLLWAIVVWIKFRSTESKHIWLLCLLSIPAWLLLPVYNSGLALVLALPFAWMLIAVILGKVINSTEAISKRALPIFISFILILFFNWMLNIDLLSNKLVAVDNEREDPGYSLIFNYLENHGDVDRNLMTIGISEIYNCPLGYVNSDGFMPEPIWPYLLDSPTPKSLKDDLVNDGFVYILSSYLPGQIPVDNKSRLKFIRFVDRYCELDTQHNQYRLYKIRGT
jgi:hypothetical protein